jgi:LysR family transcriptional regulator, benzoate and cis,cis-muconate-responsive activator of ben and cat genes
MRYFAAVAEEGSVGLAAARLHLAQPALSRQLQSLERTVGTPLLLREARGTRVTPEGARFQADVAAVFSELENTLMRVQLAARGMLGSIRIGLSRSAIDHAEIGRALGALSQRFPDLELTVNDLAEGQQARALRLGEMDIAIGPHGSPGEAMSSLPLLDLTLDGALLCDSHELAAADSIDSRSLRNETLLIAASATDGGLEAAFQQFRGLGIEEWEIHRSVGAVYSLVAAGRGWSIVQTASAARVPPGTVVRPLKDFAVKQTLSAYSRTGDLSPAVANVLAFLHRTLRDPGAAMTWTSADRAEVVNAINNIELPQLRALVALNELGSVSLAALRLGLTQSGVSRQIKALEPIVGSPVFRRTPGGVVLTAAAEALAEGAYRIIAIAESAVANAQRAVNGISGHCVVAAVSTEFSGEILVKVIRLIAERHPGITIEVAEMMTPVQVAAIRERRAHIGIAGASNGLVNDRSIRGVSLQEDVIECALLAEDHPLAKRRSLVPSDLADVPFILFERPAFPQFYDAIMDNFAAIGLVPHMAGAFNSARGLWRAANDLRGWTLGTRSLLTRPLPGMVAVPLDGLRIPSGMQLISRRDERDPMVTAVLEAFDIVRANMNVS